MEPCKASEIVGLQNTPINIRYNIPECPCHVRKISIPASDVQQCFGTHDRVSLPIWGYKFEPDPGKLEVSHFDLGTQNGTDE